MLPYRLYEWSDDKGDRYSFGQRENSDNQKEGRVNSTICPLTAFLKGGGMLTRFLCMVIYVSGRLWLFDYYTLRGQKVAVCIVVAGHKPGSRK